MPFPFALRIPSTSLTRNNFDSLFTYSSYALRHLLPKVLLASSSFKDEGGPLSSMASTSHEGEGGLSSFVASTSLEGEGGLNLAEACLPALGVHARGETC